ncbi:MAG TPA: hypothetical protein VGS03_11120 [Candidatus Polarisedimenticolia bacterium]|jgi:predicted membrane-bound spermidine synthase|nr:hypothetical protein [Candidatus Polarisedimenticolia bacterium]
MRGRAWFFAFFFLSGAGSLVFEVVWLRLAMARFGVTTPLVSMVLSLFMAGLAIGSLWAGRLDRRHADGPPGRFLRFYGLAEATIGFSAFVIPTMFDLGRDAVTAVGAAWGSSLFSLASALVIGTAIVPFCICMGATYPLAMSFLRRSGAADERLFSRLYLANLLGACVGTLLSAFVLIELLGFRKTLAVTATLHALIAAGAVVLGRDAASRSRAAPVGQVSSTPTSWTPVAGDAIAPDRDVGRGSTLLGIVFMTGLASLAMELVWVRQYTPLLGPFVYSFAAILATYLAFNGLGAGLYRAWASPGAPVRAHHGSLLLLAAGAFSFLPLLATDPRLAPAGTIPFRVAQLVFGLGPFCVASGILTPLLIDRFARGDPDKAGRAYAVNVLGCIIGPILAGFGLLPLAGERATLALLGLPFLVLGLGAALGQGRRVLGSAAAALALSGILLFATEDFEARFPTRVVRRDYAATTIATGQGRDKQLLINGYGITNLTPVTKLMAHLPAAFRASPPRDALVICFGMGTSFRSLLSWGASTTAVELVPSVPSLFGYFHADGPALLASPPAHLVIDDGRRFLERTTDQYDVITIDPPPPVEAAASSLLYSKEFYAVVRRRLRPGGIVQQWLPEGDPTVVASVTRALRESFPSLRAFHALEGWGIHYLAGDVPLDGVSVTTLADRLPPRASADLFEWGPYASAERTLAEVLLREVPVDELIAAAPRAPALTDDRPVNEYYLLRRTFAPGS